MRLICRVSISWKGLDDVKHLLGYPQGLEKQLCLSPIHVALRCAKPVVLNLGPPDVLGLQLPEAFTTTRISGS